MRKSTAGPSFCGRLLHGQPLRLVAAPEVLRLPLRPSPRLRFACGMLGIAVLLHALELLLTGHRLAAMAVVGLAACAAWGQWHRARNHASPRFLRIDTDGRLFLEVAEGGAEEETQLRPESLRLGPHVLLLLSARDRRIRLLLGPDNLDPARLASLKRRLPGPASPATALHSVPASSRSHPP